MKQQIFSMVAAFVAIISCSSASRAEHYLASPKAAILPTGEEIRLAETLTVGKGETFLTQPFGFVQVARLKSAVAVHIGGKSLNMPENDILPLSNVRTMKNFVGPQIGEFYCNLMELSAPKPVVTVYTRGKSAEGIKTDLNHIGCLQDTNTDGRFDQAIMIGEAKKAQQPVNIEPIEYETIQHISFGEEYRASIKYVGVSFNGRLIFELDIPNFTREKKNTSEIKVISPNRLPAVLHQFGSEYTILSFDEETQEIKLVIEKPLSEKEFSTFPIFGF